MIARLKYQIKMCALISEQDDLMKTYHRIVLAHAHHGRAFINVQELNGNITLQQNELNRRWYFDG